MPNALELLIMCPLSFDFMAGNTACISRRVPKKLMSKVSFAKSIEMQSKTDIRGTPALLTVRQNIVAEIRAMIN